MLEWLALFIGFQTYRYIQKQVKSDNHLIKKPAHFLDGAQFWIIMGCLLGAAIGNKVAYWLEYPHIINQAFSGQLPLAIVVSGQSIIGGLLGGLIGIEIIKKIIRYQHSTGDHMVLPIMIGTTVGRIGCLLAGLYDSTYGIPTSLWWGVDYGDGIARHPTQIYEIIFIWAWGSWLLGHRHWFAPQSGLLFKYYLAGYLLWRLFVDAIKPMPFNYLSHTAYALSGTQLLCLIALVCYVPLVVRQTLLLPFFKRQTP